MSVNGKHTNGIPTTATIIEPDGTIERVNLEHARREGAELVEAADQRIIQPHPMRGVDLGAERDSRPPKPCLERMPGGVWCWLAAGHPEWQRHQGPEPREHEPAAVSKAWKKP